MTIEVYYPDGSYKAEHVHREYYKIRNLGATKCYRWTAKECQSHNEDFYDSNGNVIAQFCHPSCPPEMSWLEYVFTRPEKKKEITAEQLSLDVAEMFKAGSDYFSTFHFLEATQSGSIINLVVSRTVDGPRVNFKLTIEEI